MWYACRLRSAAKDLPSTYIFDWTVRFQIFGRTPKYQLESGNLGVTRLAIYTYRVSSLVVFCVLQGL